ncbi:hypothetical protein [Emcibacter sp.]|uniref:hypothetical protein n=1 Tax=Emcibacter sp. TaxID=1979954 RepID=UPI002AA61638|nr:hypothetical protein [Emcibacter sp.]
MSPVLAGPLRIADDGLSAGYVTVAWPAASGTYFQLELKSEAGWRSIYAGPDRATTLSGLANGTYLLRLKSEGNALAENDILAITVRHHPLDQALAFFWGGAVIFVVLVTLLAVGNSREAEASTRPGGRSEFL